MKNSKLYHVLNFTWGLPMTLIGFIVASALRCVGYKPKKWGGCYWFTIGKNWGGLNLGLVILTDSDTSITTLDHEFGHSMQNAMFGLLFPFIIGIPSVIRYWKRNVDESKGKVLKPYDAIWFEGQATRLGTLYRPYFTNAKKG